MEFIDLKAQYNRIEESLRRRLEALMRDSRFILGRETEELESRLAAYAGVRHCVSCSSGTDALLMALMLWGLGPGDAVFVPTFTFFSTAEAVSLTGACPVFVDIEPDTFNIDADALQRTIAAVKADGRRKPKAIISVDLFGQPARNPEIEKLAADAGLFFLEDAAQGFGGEIGARKACSFGDAAATSFFPAKPLGCYGDGGAVFTNSDESAEILRSLRVHGQGREKYHNVRLGLNARLDNMQAAVLLEKMDIFEAETARKNEIAALYAERLGAYLTVPTVKTGCRSSWAQYSVLARDSAQRQMVRERLKAEGVPTMLYYQPPLHRQPVYAAADSWSNRAGGDFSVSERVSERIFSLPMHAYLSERDIDRITGVIGAALKGCTP
jgi:dTDP-4-amino-4,6-dideoxygalactose transaminase